MNQVKVRITHLDWLDRIAVVIFAIGLAAALIAPVLAHAQTAGFIGQPLKSLDAATSTGPGSGTTASIGGSALAAGQCSSTTATVWTPTSGPVSVTPNTYPGSNFYWRGYPSGVGQITVEVCAITAGTPTAGTYNYYVAGF